MITPEIIKQFLSYMEQDLDEFMKVYEKDYDFQLAYKYITQQEKKDKLLELYRERDKLQLLVRDDEVDTVDRTYYHERLIEIHQQLKTIEEDLKK